MLTVPKLRTYVMFKTSYSPEKYVLLNLKRNERSMLAQFRCGILPLRIETGRYVGEKPEDRLCKMCERQLIEDEMHFLLHVHCPFYDIHRQKLIAGTKQL